MATNQEILTRAWNLRTHPFAPKIDPEGQPIPKPEFLDGKEFAALNPEAEPKVVSFYHDVYTWENERLISGLSKVHLLEQFPKVDELVKREKSVLILISGFNHTGVQSLNNLIFAKIRKNRARIPALILVESKIGVDQDKNGIIKTLADDLIFELEEIVDEQTTHRLKGQLKRLMENPDAYLSVFDRMRRLIRKQVSRPIVLLPKEVDYHDNWQRIFTALEGLANIIIVTTKNRYHAETCAKTLNKDGKQVAHIRAEELDEEKAHDYLRKRIAILRTENPVKDNFPDIAPFSEDALHELYKDGTRPDPTRSWVFPIGKLNESLQRALDIHLKKLKQRVETDAAGLAVLDQLEESDLLIQPEQIYSARDQINQGG